MRKLKVFLALFLMMTLSMMGVGCGKNAGNLDQIKVAEVTHSIFYAPQYVAIEKGFYEEEGIKVDLLNAQGADKTMAALLSGEVQVGLMGPEASIYVYNQGSKDYAVSFAQLTKRDGSFIVGRTANENFALDELKGKEILGGRKGGVPEMTLEYAIKNAGLTIGENTAAGEVNVRTDIQFGVMAGAYVGGEGDYVTLFEPLATSLEKEGTGYIMASVGEITGEIPYTAYCTLKSYMEKNTDVIQRFTNATYKGQQFVQENTAATIAEIIAPHFKELSIEDLTTVVQRYKDIDAWCQ
ncbi:MAG: ABC transporter substrate-binding protein, partial [Cellulosilyticaceae bacterium]